MRNISEAGLAKLALRYGNEPITIIEVDWVDGSTAVYADRTIGDIPGRIVEVGELDDAVNLSGSSGFAIAGGHAGRHGRLDQSHPRQPGRSQAAGARLSILLRPGALGQVSSL